LLQQRVFSAKILGRIELGSERERRARCIMARRTVTARKEKKEIGERIGEDWTKKKLIGLKMGSSKLYNSSNFPGRDRHCDGVQLSAWTRLGWKRCSFCRSDI
jgi:hypothetical protein